MIDFAIIMILVLIVGCTIFSIKHASVLSKMLKDVQLLIDKLKLKV